jgi:RNA polymerase sigma-70 factor (ECF subfamily)
LLIFYKFNSLEATAGHIENNSIITEISQNNVNFKAHFFAFIFPLFRSLVYCLPIFLILAIYSIKHRLNEFEKNGDGRLDPEELAHEVFVRVWKSAHRYEPTARLSTWLFAIARNLVLNEIRYKTRHPAFSRDALLEDGHPEAEGPAANANRQPDAALLEAELHEAIDRALQTLPENQRTAILLRRYENVSYEEIATILEVSVSSVKSLLFRGRTALREALAEYLA